MIATGVGYPTTAIFISFGIVIFPNWPPPQTLLLPFLPKTNQPRYDLSMVCPGFLTECKLSLVSDLILVLAASRVCMVLYHSKQFLSRLPSSVTSGNMF